MHLEPGRVRGMVADAVRDDGCIPCHKTIRRDDVQPAICRGFFDAYADRVWVLRAAVGMDAVVFDDAPPDR
jgi:hypothetical protein